MMIDDSVLEKFQNAAFDYFLMRTNPENGLLPDTSREGSPASIAGVGFGLSCYPAAIERGWITCDEAIKRTLSTMRFFWNGPPGGTFKSIGHRGFCYHFLDIKTGRRAWKCELSFIDTALLLAGMMVAATYFTGRAKEEVEIRDLVDKFYRRIEWDWALNNGDTLAMSWKPKEGFAPWRWQGYDEGLIMYILGLASPTHPLKPENYKARASSYEWRKLYDIEVLYAGPLFIHQFSHAWIDFRGIHDEFMHCHDHDCDYFENSRRATLIQQKYAIENRRGFKGYGEHCWGLSAGDGPWGTMIKAGRKQYTGLGYAARGAPDGPEDGTLMPSAALSSLPFMPEQSLNAILHIQKTYPDVIQNYHIPSGFNPSLVDKNNRIWISDGYYALDQGIIMLMIENYRSGFIWDLMKKNPYIQGGLHKAGFKDG